ncbi:hypothetical protein [Polyangium aurulentum]|uniref:hypothetical protein n=1 Tax=Polyangium aurulentum TaxID=2567896 RepID=UPI0010AED425|nr:hypothetical protein [Polyangium aurulentum]UQA57997.1 hypothetical protein E8A73_043130 [Polyangium aurulentum]
MLDFAKIALAALAALSLAAGCATEEIPPYGEPARVVAGAGPSGAGSGGACAPDPSCAVKFEAQIMPILDGVAKCSATGPCHGGSDEVIKFTAGDTAGTLKALRELQIKDENLNSVPYIDACDPASSQMLCNLQRASGPSMYGKCGSLMPKVDDDGIMDIALSDAEYALIEEWIKCGAPDN